MISAEWLKAKCYEICDEYDTEHLYIDRIIDEIDNAPNVEVGYGYWIERPLDCFRKYEVKCSECGFVGIGNYDQYLEPCDFNYCPNCGADMRERKDND